MDSPTTGNTVRALTTDGNGTFHESTYTIPEMNEGDILVKAVMTGVCRSDIAMMNGEFPLLPASMHGHEGLGIDVATGKYVATRGEPAYADYYVARKDTYVEVPELDPKYIIEPVACAVNIIMDNFVEIRQRINGNVCILGTGFLAQVAFKTLTYFPELQFNKIDVVGNSNKDFWGITYSNPNDIEYDIVIDLSEKPTLMNTKLAERGLVILAADKKQPVSTTFSDWLWKNVTIKCPSPRSANFLGSMKFAVKLVEDGWINLDNTWTKGYSREDEWVHAFNDAVNRTEGYNRGYIKWD